jgi:hypothetical protein
MAALSRLVTSLHAGDVGIAWRRSAPGDVAALVMSALPGDVGAVRRLVMNFVVMSYRGDELT